MSKGEFDPQKQRLSGFIAYCQRKADWSNQPGAIADTVIYSPWFEDMQRLIGAAYVEVMADNITNQTEANILRELANKWRDEARWPR